jgi:hypothetical protein
MADNLVVTGTRIPRTSLQAPSAAKAVSPERAYGAFLSRLQSVVRSNNHHAVIGLISFPLRVNASGGALTYRDAASVERDFDRIFTPRVKRAIARQRADTLFVRNQGAMIGDGEVWFDFSCPNASCSPRGPVRIRAVNP